MVKTLLKSVRDYKKQTLLTPVFMIGEVAIGILIPYLLAKLIDDGINKGDIKVILIIGGISLIAMLFSLFFGIKAGKLSATASAGFAKNLRQDMFEKIQTSNYIISI